MSITETTPGDQRLCELVAPLMDMSTEALTARFDALVPEQLQQARTLLVAAHRAGEHHQDVDGEIANGMEPHADRIERAEQQLATAVAAMRAFLLPQPAVVTRAAAHRENGTYHPVVADVEYVAGLRRRLDTFIEGSSGADRELAGIVRDLAEHLA